MAKRTVSKKKRTAKKGGKAASLAAELTKLTAQSPMGSAVDGAFEYLDQLAADTLRDEGFFDVFDEDSEEMMDLCDDVSTGLLNALPNLAQQLLETHRDYKRLKSVVETEKQSSETSKAR